MKKFLQITLSVFCLLTFSKVVWGQDPVYSQFFTAPALVNPAFTGNTNAARIALNVRNQWPSLDAYITYSAGYDQILKSVNSGIGLSVLADNAGGGIYKLSRLNLSYAYIARMKDDKALKIGIEGSFSQVRLDWSKLKFYDQIDVLTGFLDANGLPNPTSEQQPGNLSKSFFNVSAGMAFYSPAFYTGVAVKNLTTPDESLLNINRAIQNGLDLMISVQLGSQINLHKRNKHSRTSFVSPNVILIKEGDFFQLNGGAYLNLGTLFVGSWYRYALTNSDAVILLLGFQKDIFKIGYSYDVTVSSLSAAPSGGTHEVSIVLNFENSEKYKNKQRADRYLDCFGLFR